MSQVNNPAKYPASDAGGEKFQQWYTRISVEGDVRHNMKRAFDAALPVDAAMSDSPDDIFTAWYSRVDILPSMQDNMRQAYLFALSLSASAQPA